MADLRFSDPVSSYLDDLLHDVASLDESDDIDTGRWNELLKEAVATRMTAPPTFVSTLEAGHAPVVVTMAGVGNRTQKHVQLLQLLSTLRQLQIGRLHAAVLVAAGLCNGHLQRV